MEYDIPNVTRTVFLEQSFGKGDLNSKDGRWKVSDVFTKETGSCNKTLGLNQSEYWCCDT